MKIKKVFNEGDLYLADSSELLKSFQENSIDSCVTDPPYNLTSIVKRFGGKNSALCQYGTDGVYQRQSKGFMGKEWDGTRIAFRIDFWQEIYRILKPGAHLLAFGGTRTHHRMTCAIEDAGFIILDEIDWLYASGFPKSHSISKAIDRMLGKERKVIGGTGYTGPITKHDGFVDGDKVIGRRDIELTEAASEEAKEWEGWGTAIKPSREVVIMAMRPISEKSIAANVLKWGTGAINVDGCRVNTSSPAPTRQQRKIVSGVGGIMTNSRKDATSERIESFYNPHNQGRWPANLILSHSEYCDEECVEGCPVLELDRQSGILKSGKPGIQHCEINRSTAYGKESRKDGYKMVGYGDEGGASRFFYVTKPSSKERGESNHHPTIKPVQLLRYLVRMVTPPNGICIDPFIGSGTTAIACIDEGVEFIGIEKEKEYYNIAKQRIKEKLEKRRAT